MQYQSKQGISERTQARWVSSTKAFYKYLFEEELIQENPTSLLEDQSWVYICRIPLVLMMWKN